jgi:hypothetical protein
VARNFTVNTHRLSGTSSLIHGLSLITCSIWFNRQGNAPAGGFGYLFSKSGLFEVRVTDSGDEIEFIANDWTTAGQWDMALTGGWAGNTGWNHILVTYDYSSTANEPNFHINDVQETTKLVTAPTGSTGGDSTELNIGNRAGADRAPNGYIAEAAIWNRILSAGEITALASGASPIMLLNGLRNYLPVWGDGDPEQNLITDVKWSVSGAAQIAEHPPIQGPQLITVSAGAGAPPGEITRWIMQIRETVAGQ